jgi:hypothetical protein
MCGAFAIRLPCASNSAQEKSRRSLMLTEVAVFAERHAHLLGDGHEEVVEHFEENRVDACADGAGALQGLHAAEDQVIERRDFGAPTRVDHDCGVALADDGGTGDGVAGLQRISLDERRVVPLVLEEHWARCGCRCWRCRSGFSPTLACCRAKARPTAL